MFLVKILLFLLSLALKVLSLPVVILLYLLRGICNIILALGSIVTNILAGLCVLGAIVGFITSQIGMGFGCLAGGVVIYIAPYVFAFLSDFILTCTENLVAFLTNW